MNEELYKVLEDHKIGEYEVSIKKLADQYHNQGEWLKAQFDARTDNEVKAAINGMIEALEGLFALLYTAEEVNAQIKAQINEIGAADMMKAVYDTDGDGVVDRAAKLAVGVMLGEALFDGARNVTLAEMGAAAKSHADTTGAAGVGSDKQFGHLMLTDDADAAHDAAAGRAATPKMVQAVRKILLNTLKNSYTPKIHNAVDTRYGKGTETEYGHLMLTNDVEGASGVQGGKALTPFAAKKIKQTADEAMPKAGGTFTGPVTAKGMSVYPDSAAKIGFRAMNNGDAYKLFWSIVDGTGAHLKSPIAVGYDSQTGDVTVELRGVADSAKTLTAPLSTQLGGTGAAKGALGFTTKVVETDATGRFSVLVASGKNVVAVAAVANHTGSNSHRAVCLEDPELTRQGYVAGYIAQLYDGSKLINHTARLNLIYYTT